MLNHTNNRIVLFGPKPAADAFFDGVPMALLGVSRILDAEGGYDIKIISASSKENYLQTIDKLLAEGAICIGISSMTGYQIQDGLNVAKMVRQKYPHIPIVWGGWHPTICPEQTVVNPYVDIVVRGGQGERTFAELVHALKANKPLKNILGISYKAKGKVIHNSDRSLEDINNFPPLPYHLIDMEKYIRVSEYGSRTIDYVSSIGCPHRCAFCSEKMVNHRRWSGLEPKKVVDDLKLLSTKYKVNAVFFQDSNFFVNEERVRDICKRLIKLKLPLKLGQLDARTSQLVKYRKDTWAMMRDSGFVSLLVGAESGSQKVLDFIHKDTQFEETIEMAKICKSFNIGIILSLMLGFPHKKGIFTQPIEDEFKETCSMIDRAIATGVDLNICGWFVFTPYPGTDLYQVSVDNKWIAPKTLEEWAEFNLGGKNTPWITKKYVDLLDQLSRYIFPCMGTTYIKAWENKRKATYFQTPFSVLMAIFILKILQKAARFRWKYKFFYTPVENHLIKLYSNRIKDLRLFNRER